MANDETNYLFVDAGYLRRIIADVLIPIIGQEVEISWPVLKTRFSAQRVFYYDCLDEIKRDSESEDQYSVRLKRQQENIDHIREQDGYHVRLGTISGNARRRRQKEVDVLLAVDMLMHSHNKNMNTAFLLAGDLDFKPVVDALVQLGTRVSVVCNRKNTSKKLAYSADSRLYLSLRDLWKLLKNEQIQDAFPKFGMFHKEFDEENPIETGQREGKVINIYLSDSTYYVVMPLARDVGLDIHWKYNDLTRLKECLSIEFENITWNKP